MTDKNNDKKNNLVMIMGLAGAGKTYRAKHYYSNHTIISLADSLRNMCLDCLDSWSDIMNTPKNYSDFKKSKIVLKKSFFKTKSLLTGREYMQKFSDVMKDYFGNNIWIKLWSYKVEHFLKEGCNVVCDDVRYVSEIRKGLSLLRKCKVDFIWVCYPENNYIESLNAKHSSEQLAIFMYNNMDKYGLYHGCKVGHNKIKQIIKDFENSVCSTGELLPT